VSFNVKRTPDWSLCFRLVFCVLLNLVYQRAKRCKLFLLARNAVLLTNAEARLCPWVVRVNLGAVDLASQQSVEIAN
jgi:hypothetical protein